MSECYFCGEGDDVLQEHHIVPRRFDGSDGDENLVELCPTCHRKIESLYDKRFYDALGVSPDGSNDLRECWHEDCTVETKRRIPITTGGEMPVCDGHTKCRQFCGQRVAYAIPRVGDGGYLVVCSDHATCEFGGCKSTETEVHDGRVALCEQHAHEHKWGEYGDE